MEPWISGVTAVEGIKILRPHNIEAYAKVGQNMDTRRGPGAHNPILSEPVIACTSDSRP